MCNQDPLTLSKWEEYQCDYIRNRDGYEKCWPQRRMSSGCLPGTTLKGAVFLYHGYSACPDQYNDIAPKLQAQCWHVYQILTIGHGYDYCSDNTTNNCAGSMYNISLMPTQRQPYIDFITMMIDIITDEVNIIKQCETQANAQFITDNLQVAIGGLSFGAPLAAASVILSGVNSIFTKHILMSPFFGISYKGIDDTIYKCLLNTKEFKNCLPMYFEQIGFDINQDEANDLSDMIINATTSYVNLNALDTSFETFNLIIRKIIEWIIEYPNAITNTNIKSQIDDILDSIIGWGDQCELDVFDRNRGGFCQFKVRNLAAAHSFGVYTIDLLKDSQTQNNIDTSVELLIIMVERDGPTRNSLPINYANLFYDSNKIMIANKAIDCMWLIDSSCLDITYNGVIDNNCGVPHSSLAHADNLGISPGILWWENTYHNGLINWLNSEPQNEQNFIVKNTWNGQRDQCVYLDLIHPPHVLVADVPQLITIGFNIIGGTIIENIQNAILNDISDKIGVSRGVLELTVNILSSNINWKNTNINDNDGDYVEIEMNLDENSAAIMETILQYDGIDEIGNEIVEYVKLKGIEYYDQFIIETTTQIPSVNPTITPTVPTVDSGRVDITTTVEITTENAGSGGKKENDNKTTSSSWYVFIIVLVLLLILIGGIWYYKMKNSNAKNAKENIGMVKMTANVNDTGDADEQVNMVDKTDDGDKGNDTKKETIDEQETQETQDKDENSDDESSASFIQAGKPTKR
eukprot:325891_1